MFILTTKTGFVYKGPDGMPITSAIRSNLTSRAISEGLTDWRIAEIGQSLLDDLNERSLATVARYRCLRI